MLATKTPQFMLDTDVWASTAYRPGEFNLDDWSDEIIIYFELGNYAA